MSDPGSSDPGSSDPGGKPVRSEPVRSAPDPFGDVLPDRTRDEEAEGWSESWGYDPDEHLRREVPPHHR